MFDHEKRIKDLEDDLKHLKRALAKQQIEITPYPEFWKTELRVKSFFNAILKYLNVAMVHEVADDWKVVAFKKEGQ